MVTLVKTKTKLYHYGSNDIHLLLAKIDEQIVSAWYLIYFSDTKYLTFV